MSTDYKHELLTTSCESRIKEITEYQVNIDNFTIAIERIGDDPELQDFKVQLEELLASSKREQTKAKIILDSIQTQLESYSD